GNRFEPEAELDQRLADSREGSGRLLGQFDEIAVELCRFGFDTVAHLLTAALVASVSRCPHRGEQCLERPKRITFREALQPAVAGQRLGGLARLRDRLGAGFVVTGDIGKPRRKPAPASARAFLWPDDPALELDRFLAGERRGKGAVGRFEHMVAFVEYDAGGALRVVAPA